MMGGAGGARAGAAGEMCKAEAFLCALDSARECSGPTVMDRAQMAM